MNQQDILGRGDKEEDEDAGGLSGFRTVFNFFKRQCVTTKKGFSSPSRAHTKEFIVCVHVINSCLNVETR